jgi:hypothetical protein
VKGTGRDRGVVAFDARRAEVISPASCVLLRLPWLRLPSLA